MKTILIVIAGMADVPDPLTGQETPLVATHVPALDLLARRGELTAIPPLSEGEPVSHVNALLSLLGYDLARGIPNVEQLMEFGLDNSSRISDFDSLRPFVIPGFSGHGVCVTPSAWVRGAAKCALLKPLDIYSPGAADTDLLNAMAQLTCSAIANPLCEFVLVYYDSPLRAALKGNFEAKKQALELIDRHLISTVADFVWKSELFINMAVTTDLVTPWHRRRPILMPVPLALYYNNLDQEGDPELNFNEVTAMLSPRNFNSPDSLIRYLINFNVSEEELPQNPLP
ncbi:MAG: hypothetical protein J1D77_01555 [Muribaculaceae bacterium]|nr:hypothetical protein [Muribaculaceae bacterium]